MPSSGRAQTGALMLLASATLGLLAPGCAPVALPPAPASAAVSAPPVASSPADLLADPAPATALPGEVLYLRGGGTRPLPRASTPGTSERPAYPRGDHPLLIISDNHLDCPADHPRAFISHVEVAEGRICLQAYPGPEDFQRWVFAPADPPSEPPPRRRRYRLCVDDLGSLPSRPILVRGVRLPIAISAADFPGGEAPELLNLSLVHTTNSDHGPAACQLLYPTFRVTGGAPLPEAVNLLQAVPIP